MPKVKTVFSMDIYDHPLNEYLFHGEGENLEFKQTINDEFKIAKTICAFANTNGGTILIGVKDNKTIVGVDPEEERHLMEKASDFLCDPPVKVAFEEIYWDDHGDADEKTILKATIHTSGEKPHYAQNKTGEWIAYLRYQDKTLLAGPRAIAAMKNHKNKVVIELTKNEDRLLAYLRDNERITLKKYMDLVNISSRRARRELHDALGKGIIRTLQHEKEDYYVI
jgi:predicted HTH transcriptional regulator